MPFKEKYLMDEKSRWPKKGDNPFLVGSADPSSPTWASLQWLASMKVDDAYIATAFKEAGDKIIKELSRGEDIKHCDMFFMPIAYLYRHSMELQMKEIIRLGIRLGLIEKDEKLTDVLKDHNLHYLWNVVRKVVAAYWPNGPQDDLNAAERIVQEFHQIDKCGQNFRYSKDLKGHSSLERFPESVQLKHLQDVFGAIFNFLDGCETGLDHAMDMRNEMLSNYYDNSF